MPSQLFQTTGTPPFNYQGRGSRFQTVSTTAATPAWSPLNITGLVAWYDASDPATITSSGGLVSQWDDKSGNANHATQATGAYKPTTGTRTQNSLNVIEFISQDFLETAVSSVQANTSAFLVCKFDGVGGNTVLGPRTGSGGFQVRNPQNQLLAAAVGLIATATTTQGTTNPAIIGITRVNGASGAWAFYLNGSANGSGTDSTSWTGSSALEIGGQGGDGDSLDGYIAEMVYCSTILSSGDRNSLTTYLNTKWAVY